MKHGKTHLGESGTHGKKLSDLFCSAYGRQWYLTAIQSVREHSYCASVLNDTMPSHTGRKLVQRVVRLRGLCTGGHRTRVAAVTLDNMAETRSPLRKIYRKFSPCLFVTAAQLLCVDCQCYGTHWRGIPSCSDSVSRRNSDLKFRVMTRVSVVSVSPGTRVSVSLDEGTAVYKWT